MNIFSKFKRKPADDEQDCRVLILQISEQENQRLRSALAAIWDQGSESKSGTAKAMARKAWGALS